MLKLRPTDLRTVLIPVCLATATVACNGADTPGQSEASGRSLEQGMPEEWILSESPVLEIGVREGEEPYQLHRARGSVLLEDGRVVVLNGGSQELRYYDPEGRFLKSVGGLGEGPGEFRDPANLRKTADGNLQVWDRSLMRVSIFGIEGEFRSLSTLLATREEMFPGDDWLLGENWIVSPVSPGARGPIREAVSSIPLPDSTGTLRTLRVTPQGRIWRPDVRPPADSAVSWEIFDMEGIPVATLSTPARFEPHEIGEDYLTGLFLDELDVNFVRVYEIQKPEGAAPGPGLDLAESSGRAEEVPASPPPPDEVIAGIQSLLKNMASLEEIYYSNHYTYTRDLDALFANSRVGIPDDLAVDILYAGTEAWALTVSHPESGGRCFLGYGRFVPMGWQPGAIVCL
ncbi:MAG: hypothetical protein PVJ76_00140 [Gemmatimonadota bacterium]